jgi:hypothetical protein
MPAPDPMLRPGTDLCRCGACGEHFRSSGTFGLHRVGDWENRGAHRRCLSVTEMTARGWLKDNGYWIRGRMPASASTRLRPAEIVITRTTTAGVIMLPVSTADVPLARTCPQPPMVTCSSVVS